MKLVPAPLPPDAGHVVELGAACEACHAHPAAALLILAPVEEWPAVFPTAPSSTPPAYLLMAVCARCDAKVPARMRA